MRFLHTACGIALARGIAQPSSKLCDIVDCRQAQLNWKGTGGGDGGHAFSSGVPVVSVCTSYGILWRWICSMNLTRPVLRCAQFMYYIEQYTVAVGPLLGYDDDTCAGGAGTPGFELLLLRSLLAENKRKSV